MPIQTTRLLQFSRQFKKFYAHRFRSLLEESGLTMREMDVLLFLANNPLYDTARDIADLRGLSKSQVSQAVDLLAAEGLLLRTPDVYDRRIIHLSITPEGLPLSQAAQAAQADCVQHLLAGLTPEQEAQLATILHIVLDNGDRLSKEAEA